MSANLIGALHTFVQFLGFHLIFLNFTVGLRLLLPYDTNATIITPYISIPFAVILTIVFVCYWFVSRQEMRRRYHNYDKDQTEHKWQLRGNIFLFSLYMFLIFMLRKDLIVMYFFVEQMVVGLSFLLQNRTSTA